MNESDNSKSSKQKNLKIFFIKLFSISIAIIIIINLLFNLIFAERLEKIDKILLLNKKEYRNEIKEKIRDEINEGLKKEKLIPEEDKILLYKFYLKIIKEFQDLDKNKF